MTRQPFLLIQTPRAGAANFRFLASTNSGLSESEAAELAAAAAQAPGDTTKCSEFVAIVARNVPQANGGRTGDEVIIFVGVRANGVSANAVLPILRHILDCELPALLRRVDWSQQSGILIEREELTRWRDEILAATCPTGGWTWRRIGAALILLLAVSAGIFVYSRKDWWTGLTALFTGHAAGPLRLRSESDLKTRIVEFVRHFEITDNQTEAAVADLLESAGYERPRRDDPLFWTRLNENPPARLVDLLRDGAAAADFRHFLLDATATDVRGPLKDLALPGISRQEAVHVRSVLFALGQQIEKLPSADQQPALKSPLLKLACDFAQKRRGLPTREVTAPMLPFFGSQDQRIVESIQDFVQSAEGDELWGGPEPRDFRARLIALQVRAKTLQETAKAEYKELPGALTTVARPYWMWLDDFLELLGHTGIKPPDGPSKRPPELDQ